MTRYLLVVNFEGGVVETPMEEWKPEEIEAHLDYYRALNEELRESGELVAPGDRAALHLALVRLLGDTSRRERLAAAARAAAAGPYSWDAIAADHLALYERL